MGPKSYPLRALGLCLRSTLLLAAGPVSGAAQATGGFTTAFAMATEAAVRAVTTRVYPAADRFRLIGVPEESWDWPHIELPGPLGYRSIEALLLAAQTAELGAR
jgi:hypothetical protein